MICQKSDILPYHASFADNVKEGPKTVLQVKILFFINWKPNTRLLTYDFIVITICMYVIAVSFAFYNTTECLSDFGLCLIVWIYFIVNSHPFVPSIQQFMPPIRVKAFSGMPKAVTLASSHSSNFCWHKWVFLLSYFFSHFWVKQCCNSAEFVIWNLVQILFLSHSWNVTFYLISACLATNCAIVFYSMCVSNSFSSFICLLLILILFIPFHCILKWIVLNWRQLLYEVNLCY